MVGNVRRLKQMPVAPCQLSGDPEKPPTVWHNAANTSNFNVDMAEARSYRLREMRASMPRVKIRQPFDSDLDEVLLNGMPQTFARLADIHRTSGRFDQAESLCRDGVKEFPDYGSGHMVLALTCHERGETERALIELHSALKCEPDNILALKLIADIHWESRQFSLARSYYRQVLELDRYCDDAGKRVRRRREPGPKGEPDAVESAGDLHSNPVSDGQDAFSTVTLAKLYAQQGHIRLARQVCEGILEKEPGNVRVRDFLRELDVTTGNN